MSEQELPTKTIYALIVSISDRDVPRRAVAFNYDSQSDLDEAFEQLKAANKQEGDFLLFDTESGQACLRGSVIFGFEKFTGEVVDEAALKEMQAGIPQINTGVALNECNPYMNVPRGSKLGGF